ncbi:hypothetical protein AGMMS50293_27070 [Spirochaetia bacterium]|nr:hypothetical protein AGMMS50293_27070 [Spirochaetia bacterium]
MYYNKKILFYVITILAFIFYFLLIFALIQRIWTSGPMFYRSIVVTFSAFILGLVVILCLKFLKEKRENIILSLVAAASLSFAFIVIGPVILERSYSARFIGVLYEYPAGIDRVKFERELDRTNQIVKAGFDLHVYEQESSGFVAARDDGGIVKYYLTKRGRMIRNFLVVVYNIFAIPKEGRIIRYPDSYIEDK